VSRGCSRGKESCSLYLADPITIIEVRGEEVLASTLDGDKMWRRVLGYHVFPSCDESMDWDLYGDDFLLCFAAATWETRAFTLPLFLSFRVRPLKAAYSQ
jgi:hypothetical protein